MEDMMLAIVVLVLFVFGYFVIVRFGKMVERKRRRYQGPQETDREVYAEEERYMIEPLSVNKKGG